MLCYQRFVDDPSMIREERVFRDGFSLVVGRARLQISEGANKVETFWCYFPKSARNGSSAVTKFFCRSHWVLSFSD